MKHTFFEKLVVGQIPKQKVVWINFIDAVFCLLSAYDWAMQTLIWFYMVQFRAI